MSSNVAGAAVEAAADVGMCGSHWRATSAPDAPLGPATHRRVPTGALALRASAARIRSIAIDELRSAPKATSDLTVIDAVGDEAQDAAFHRPQGIRGYP